jgi:dolichol-phosphate mannosyltransferase
VIKRFIQFGLVGASGVFVDMGILFVLADPQMLGWGLSLSKALAAETAILNNFLWNDLWTFRDLAAGQAGWHLRVRRFGKFNLICLLGIALNVLLLNVQVHLLQMNVYVANLIAILLVSVWNFSMNLTFGWGKPAVPE